jgi:hypothetical protein
VRGHAAWIFFAVAWGGGLGCRGSSSVAPADAGADHGTSDASDAAPADLTGDDAGDASDEVCVRPGEASDGGAPVSSPVSFSVAHGIVAPEPDGGVVAYDVPDDGYAVTFSPRLTALPADATLTDAKFSIVDLTRGGLAYPIDATLAVSAGPDIGYEPLRRALPPGQMAVTTELNGSLGVDGSVSTSFTSRAFQVVTICGPRTVDTVTPEIPPVTPINVTVDRLEYAPSGSVVTLSFTTLDRTFSARASATFPAAGGTSVVIPIRAPLGVPLIPEIAGAGVAPTVTLAGDATVSMPTLVSVSGSITTSDAINPAESSVVCTVPLAPTADAPFPPLAQTFTGTVTGGASPYAYALLVPKGVSCALTATLAIDVAGGAGFPGFLTSPAVTFDGTNTSQSFTLPPLPGQQTFYVSPSYVRGGEEASGSEHFRAASTSLAGGLDGWTLSKDFNHLHTLRDWGLLLPGTYDLFESEP